MKKVLCFILALILCFGVISACNNNGAKTSETGNEVSTSSGKTTEDKELETTPDSTPVKENAPSQKNDDKKTTSENNNVPSGNPSDFYLILNGTNEESILYHTGACPLLKDKEVQKTSWEMIEMLEFRHCAKCNPPKYKGYVE